MDISRDTARSQPGGIRITTNVITTTVQGVGRVRACRRQVKLEQRNEPMSIANHPLRPHPMYRDIMFIPIHNHHDHLPNPTIQAPCNDIRQPSSPTSSSGLNKLEPFRHQLRDVLVLVLQQPQRKRHIIPLPLCITTRETRSEFLGQLLGVFILFHLLAHVGQYPSWESSPSQQIQARSG